MIAKKRTYPLEIMTLEAIVRRFPPFNPRRSHFEKKLHRKRAGYRGEQTLDYYIGQIDHSELTILQDLRIPYNGTYFQIDTLLISSAFILVIESKNYAGTLEFFPEFNQLIRTLNGVEESFPDPIIQTKIQASQLKSFLSNNHMNPPPIEYLVTMSNSQSTIKNPTNNKEVSHRVCRSSSISFKIPAFTHKYGNNVLSKKEIKKVVKLLLKSDEPYIPDITTMNLPLSEILKGVQCPNCTSIGMQRIHGNWVCRNCAQVSKDAHIPAVKDYFLIYGPAVTNKQIREFLLIDSPALSNRILLSLELKTIGKNKGRLYFPNNNFFD